MSKWWYFDTSYSDKLYSDTLYLDTVYSRHIPTSVFRQAYVDIGRSRRAGQDGAKGLYV